VALAAQPSSPAVLEAAYWVARVTGDADTMTRLASDGGVEEAEDGGVASARLVFKVVLVGESCAGKTTLLKALVHCLQPGGLVPDGSGFARRRRGTSPLDRTVGIDVSLLEVNTSVLPKACVLDDAMCPLPIVAQGRCRLLVYDAAGHTEFYVSHQPFLTRQCLYLIVYRLTWAEARVAEYVRLWTECIVRQTRGGRAAVVLVGTHADAPHSEDDGGALDPGARMEVARRTFAVAAKGTAGGGGGLELVDAVSDRGWGGGVGLISVEPCGLLCHGPW
jgi:GTPase SAR1 family protein